jgi:monovalent cation/proton antiporter MnhG/PhaG subunit
MVVSLALHHPFITGLLVWAAVALAVLCSIGIVVMRDPFQRLHFSAAVVSWSAPLLTIAVWLEDSDWQARLKAILITLILFWMNSILTHATARAIRLRQVKHLEPHPNEGIQAPRKE